MGEEGGRGKGGCQGEMCYSIQTLVMARDAGRGLAGSCWTRGSWGTKRGPDLLEVLSQVVSMSNKRLKIAMFIDVEGNDDEDSGKDKL